MIIRNIMITEAAIICTAIFLFLFSIILKKERKK